MLESISAMGGLAVLFGIAIAISPFIIIGQLSGIKSEIRLIRMRVRKESATVDGAPAPKESEQGET